MRILFITKHNPFVSSGGAIATRAFIKMFSKLSDGNIDVCMAKECYSIDKAEDLSVKNWFLVEKRSAKDILVQYPFGVFHRYKNYLYSMSDNLKEYDYVVLDNSSISSTFVKFLKKKNIKTFTIHHNFEPEYFEADAKKSIIKPYLKLLVKNNEKIAYQNTSYNIFLTDSDREKFNVVYGKSNSIEDFVIAPFFNKELFLDNKLSDSKKYDFIISCSLNNKQNSDTIFGFFNKYKCEELEKSNILITGREPSVEMEKFLSELKNVTLIKNPTNDELQNLLLQSKAYLCPIEIGGGIKVRCFDAMKALIPALVHENSLRGYEDLAKSGYFSVYNDSQSLSEGIKKILNTNSFDFDLIKNQIIDAYDMESCVEKIKLYLTV